MKSTYYSIIFLSAFMIVSCTPKKAENSETTQDSTATKETFNYLADRFADIQVLRYQVPGFEELSLQQKQLAYYMYMAGRSGRDIFYDQKYKHNLRIRKTLETILTTYNGDKKSDNYNKFLTYSKRFFFANGIHHHYSNAKIIPEFSFDYFKTLITGSDAAKIPLDGMKMDEFLSTLQTAMFDPAKDAKCVNLAKDIDNVKESAVNYYEGVTKKEVEDYYSKMTIKGVDAQPSWGLNSKLMKDNQKLVEKTWKAGGMYDAAMQKMIYWLEKATTVAENDVQKKTLEALVKFYKSGDLKDYDDFCVSWVSDTLSRLDISTGFIEVYMDPMHKKGAYEAVVSMKDMEATKRIAAIAKEAQWFEDHSPIMNGHKKKNVKGISAKVITVITECGDAAPSTPIGINLPNADWIRDSIGSKSVSLGNIVEAYNYVRTKSPMIDEFGESTEVIDRYKKYGSLSGDLHTDMHEVIGHASGQINHGVGTTDVTLKNYASTLEEARADLVALYYIMDQKLVDMGVMPSLEVGKAQYDYYLLNGLMTQLYRIQPGDNIEESHMRNRQMIAAWAFEKGEKDAVVVKEKRDGKAFLKINDYDKLRVLFGELLKEIQRIKSEGDFKAGQNLVENYGVKADQDMIKEVHQRYEKLNIPPYMGFIQPRLVPVMSGDSITDVKLEYPDDFIGQMLEYAKDFSFLPVKN
ncbi:MAG: dihydrofolate reductase [Bacteroidia bacterium]